MAASQTERQSKHREAKRAEGLCTKNGCHNKHAPGVFYCESCRQDASRRKSERYADANSLYVAGKWHPCLRCLKNKPLVKPSARYDPMCQTLVDEANEQRKKLRLRAKGKATKKKS